jgi:hypothetical protein
MHPFYFFRCQQTKCVDTCAYPEKKQMGKVVRVTLSAENVVREYLSNYNC